jgi:hypothetical protein
MKKQLASAEIKALKLDSGGSTPTPSAPTADE